MPLKPFLKWVGGKGQLLDEIEKHFPTEINNYYEPFVGGGSVLFRIIDLISTGHLKLNGTMYIGDTNQALINTYKQIQVVPKEVFLTCSGLVKLYHDIPDTDIEINRKATTQTEALTSKESFYYWIRYRFNHLPAYDTVEASALFIFLNKTCFRGLYRVGPNGFNVPYGNYKSPTIINREHINQISSMIQKVVFECVDFRSLNDKEIGDHDVVYFDPPYVPEKTTSFVKYAEKGFVLKDHEDLFNQCDKLRDQGAIVILSNSAVNKVIQTFSDTTKWTTQIIECRRAINSKKPSSKTNEVLIVSE